MPPPGRSSDKGSERPRRPARGESGVQASKPNMPAATVDEVTADMSKDPRRERDDGEDEEPE